MTEKEMIEEMAKDVCQNTNTKMCADGTCPNTWDCPLSYSTIKILAKKGYRKIPEGGAILSKEENEKWVEWLEMNIKKARKETARKFASFVKSKLFDLGNIVNERDIDDMLKEFQ
jgi:hypothetical protein